MVSTPAARRRASPRVQFLRRRRRVSGSIRPARRRQRYTADSGTPSGRCRLLTSNAIRRGPHHGCCRRASNTAASSTAGIWCGHCRGRCDRSAKPSRPSASYLPSQACRLCRDTPIAAATSVTVRPSLITASTARYRCSATLISLIRECQGSTEVTVNHQPKLCKASAEVEKSSLNRGNTQIMELTGRLELPTCCLQDSCATDCATPARRLFALMEAL